MLALYIGGWVWNLVGTTVESYTCAFLWSPCYAYILVSNLANLDIKDSHFLCINLVLEYFQTASYKNIPSHNITRLILELLHIFVLTFSKTLKIVFTAGWELIFRCTVPFDCNTSLGFRGHWNKIGVRAVPSSQFQSFQLMYRAHTTFIDVSVFRNAKATRNTLNSPSYIFNPVYTSVKITPILQR